MAEYIEREAFITHIRNEAKGLRTKMPMDLVIEGVVNEVKQFPAADVVPVRHGRWVKARSSWCTPGGDPVWECSECGKGVHVYGIEYGTYGKDIADGQWVACPNCGTKMDGGINDGV